MGENVRERIAKRAAEELEDGMVVNLGIGIPTLVAECVGKKNIFFHAENGILGTSVRPNKGEEDPNLCNAGGYPISLVKGASYFDSGIAFGMIRRGYLDMTILGGLEVSVSGDLANWIVPNKRVPGMGGAMELASKSKKVVVLMNHLNRDGNSKIVEACTFPLTAKKCVDLIITDMGVFKVTEKGLRLCEVMAPYTVEEVIKLTNAPLHLADEVRTIQ